MSRRLANSSRANRERDNVEMPPPSASQNGRLQRSRVTQASQASQGSRSSQASRMSQAGPSSQEDYDDSLMPSSSQTSRANKDEMSEEEENHLVASVIRYLLVANRSKSMIQRANIVKQTMASRGRHFKFIISTAKDVLREVFGYNLVELEGNKYILANNIANNDLHLQFSKSERAEMVLLFIALGHIFMIDETGCSEGELFDLFRSLDIIEENNFMHEYFGDVKYLIAEKFIKQGYLQLVNIDKSDTPLRHYQWGPRAEHELTPRSVLEFMSKIFGGRPLNTWPVQFKLMQTREESS